MNNSRWDNGLTYTGGCLPALQIFLSYILMDAKINFQCFNYSKVHNQGREMTMPFNYFSQNHRQNFTYRTIRERSFTTPKSKEALTFVAYEQCEFVREF